MQERAFLTGCGRPEKARSISSWKNHLSHSTLDHCLVSDKHQHHHQPLYTELFWAGLPAPAKQEHSQIYTRIWDRGFLLLLLNVHSLLAQKDALMRSLPPLPPWNMHVVHHSTYLVFHSTTTTFVEHLLCPTPSKDGEQGSHVLCPKEAWFRENSHYKSDDYKRAH